MAFRISRADYYYATTRDEAGEGYELLATLARLGVDLVAFAAVPFGPFRTQLTIFPKDPGKLAREAQRAGLALDGPHPALLVQGDDELGALAQIHGKLRAANVDVYASSGVADGRGSFGYVIYPTHQDFERAALALEI